MPVDSKPRYSENVFINCPFDDEYDETFRTLVFCVIHLGFRPRCALEIDDAAEVRIEKLFRIIGDCQYGIHDLSRTQLDAATELPRFNMPLELGVFLAARRFGTGRQKQKSCLVLDSEPFRYQVFISDIAGQDIRAHHNEPADVIRLVRNWLRTSDGRTDLSAGQRFTVISNSFAGRCRTCVPKPGWNKRS